MHPPSLPPGCRIQGHPSTPTDFQTLKTGRVGGPASCIVFLGGWLVGCILKLSHRFLLTEGDADGIHVELTMILEIDPVEPEPWLLARATQVLGEGGVVVMPTDTVYGMTCGITHHEAIRRIYKLKDMDPKKPLSILVGDMSMVGRYARGVSTPAFRLLKRVLPGPYTFVFEASPEVPRIMLRKRRTIGIRMPDNPIALALLEEMGEPLLSSSIRGPEQDFVNDPEVIDVSLGDDVEMVIDGGILLPVPSTVVDLSGSEPVLLREGKGDVATLELF